MKNVGQKLILIHLPLVAVSWCCLLLYSALNWVFVVQLEWIAIKQTVLNFVGPLIMAAVLVFFFLRRRIGLLEFKKENSSFFMFLMAFLIVGVPTIIAQEYIETATGKLTPLKSIAEINTQKKTKYYSLKSVLLDTKAASFETVFTRSGKNNETIVFSVYCIQPLISKPSDTIDGFCNYWLTTKYQSSVSDYASIEKKEAIFKAFLQKTEKEFYSTNFNKFTYLELINSTEAEFKTYQKALRKNDLYESENDVPLFFIAHKEAFSERNGNKLAWIFISLCIGMLLYFVFLLFFKLDQSKWHRFKNNIEEQPTFVQKDFEFFIPKGQFFITPILIYLNVIVFIAMVFYGLGFFSFDTADLVEWGANSRQTFQHGDWWRLLTSTFLHGGLIHLISNMFSLFIVGYFLEPLMGIKRFLILYLVCGFLASFSSIFWYDSIVSVGASGAIFGMFGVLLSLIIFKVFSPTVNKPFLIMIAFFIGYNIIVGLISTGIDNAAHVGGLLCGFFIGTLLDSNLKDTIAEKATLKGWKSDR